MPSQVFAYLWIWTLSLNWNQIIMSVYLWLWNDSFFKKCSFVNLYRNSCNPKTGTLPGELWTKNSPEVVKWHGKFVKHGQRCWLKTKRAATNSGKRLRDQQVHTSKKPVKFWLSNFASDLKGCNLLFQMILARRFPNKSISFVWKCCSKMYTEVWLWGIIILRFRASNHEWPSKAIRLRSRAFLHHCLGHHFKSAL